MEERTVDIPNGPGAAAILAAGIGCGALGLFALLGDAFPGISSFFNFYRPTGALSGVSTCAIVIWLGSWLVLSQIWKEKDVPLGKVSTIAFVLLAVGMAFTFPPIMDFIQGK